MVDYGQNPDFIYRIETRLDEPMALAGIKVFSFFPIASVVLVSLFTTNSLPLALIVLFLSVAWFRRLFRDEKLGDPTTHRGLILRIAMRLPTSIRIGLCPSLLGIRLSSKRYRR